MLRAAAVLVVISLVAAAPALPCTVEPLDLSSVEPAVNEPVPTNFVWLGQPMASAGGFRWFVRAADPAIVDERELVATFGERGGFTSLQPSAPLEPERAYEAHLLQDGSTGSRRVVPFVTAPAADDAAPAPPTVTATEIAPLEELDTSVSACSFGLGVTRITFDVDVDASVQGLRLDRADGTSAIAFVRPGETPVIHDIASSADRGVRDYTLTAIDLAGNESATEASVDLGCASTSSAPAAALALALALVRRRRPLQN